MVVPFSFTVMLLISSCGNELSSFGLLPAACSSLLVYPSPSGSASARDAADANIGKCSRCQVSSTPSKS